MGLSAGQARLLSITARKSDCEFGSMRLSHQKIALARELADLSNEYQNSLNQTKLVYDYYGTGDTSTQLSYGLLMYPSALNDYMPTVITDSMGRVALNSRYAAAARAAGIPQEGLGTLPSEDMRNAFVQALATEGLITEKLATTIQGLPYNQAAGFGGGTTVAVMTDSGNFDEFCEYLKGSLGDTISITLSGDMVHGDRAEMWLFSNNEDKKLSLNSGSSETTSNFSLADLLNGTETAEIYTYNKKSKNPNSEMASACQGVLENILDQAEVYLADALDLGDGYTAKALEYAKTKVLDLYIPMNDDGTYNTKFLDDTKHFNGDVGDTNKASQYIGWVNHNYKCGWGNNRSKNQVSIGNMLNTYLTYFADYMNGISATGSDGSQVFDVNKGQTTGSHLASDNVTFEYTWKVGSEVSSDDCALVTFYDTLFNQICANGWTENDEVNDNEYLQQMLQGGMMFVSKTKDDGYYYQTNYATDTYIKEVPDETLIAYAESKYNTEKAKLNAKEETIDLKMKNLDTEISSLTTEYDTVKNTISKNIEKSFKRYNA